MGTPEPVEECVVDGCAFTTAGGKPLYGLGSWRPECMVNWSSTDPEDLEPYGEYLRDLRPDQRSMAWPIPQPPAARQRRGRHRR